MKKTAVITEYVAVVFPKWQGRKKTREVKVSCWSISVGNVYSMSCVPVPLRLNFQASFHLKEQQTAGCQSQRDSPARSDALDEDDPHTISHLVCEAHWSINKGSTLLPNKTEIKDCYSHCSKAQRIKIYQESPWIRHIINALSAFTQPFH